MLGIVKFRWDVGKVLENEFSYDSARGMRGANQELFNHVTKKVKDEGGKSYDGATVYLLAVIHGMENKDHPFHMEGKLNEVTEEEKRDIRFNVRRLAADGWYSIEFTRELAREVLDIQI